MEWKDILIITPSLVSIGTLVFIIAWRKKDYQISLAKEQIISYRSFINDLFDISEAIRKLHGEKVAQLILKRGLNYKEEELHSIQLATFIEFKDRFKSSYSNFQKQTIVLPKNVIVAGIAYFEYLGDLFENQNNSDLSMKLHVDLNEKIYDAIYAIRKNLVVDDLTDGMVKLLSKGQQFTFSKI